MLFREKAFVDIKKDTIWDTFFWAGSTPSNNLLMDDQKYKLLRCKNI